MMRIRPCHNRGLRFLAALPLLLTGVQVQAQNIILHLRNGDRIAGTILSETTNEVKLSTVWAKELTVPVAQIERREVPPQTAAAPVTNAPALAALRVKGGMQPAQTNTWRQRWKGEAEVGLDVERGATDHELYHGKTTLTYAQAYANDPKQFFKNVLSYDAEYGQTDGTLSDNRMNGSSKTDLDLTRIFYLYNLGSAGYDEIRKINLRYEEGPGAGYHWIRQTNLQVNLELGADYQVEERSDNTQTKSAYFRFGQNLTWKLNKQMTLTEKYSYSPEVSDYAQFRMRFESTLSYALILNLSLNFAVIDLYDTRPALGVPNNDLQIRTSLGVKF
jgi:putative salt-induced outer membrane protein YdiY